MKLMLVFKVYELFCLQKHFYFSFSALHWHSTSSIWAILLINVWEILFKNVNRNVDKNKTKQNSNKTLPPYTGIRENRIDVLSRLLSTGKYVLTKFSYRIDRKTQIHAKVNFQNAIVIYIILYDIFKTKQKLSSINKRIGIELRAQKLVCLRLPCLLNIFMPQNPMTFNMWQLHPFHLHTPEENL